MKLFLSRLLALLFCVTALAAAASLRVTDDTGAVVSLTQPAQRIISLAPHITEMLFSAGAGDKIVGTVAYSDYPAAAKNIVRIGSSQQLDFERILALRPDLVVGWASGNPANALKRLKELGLTLYLSEPRTLEDIAHNIEQLAVLTGTEEQARKATQLFRQRVQDLRTHYKNAEPVSVFYEMWHQPLMTLNGEHIVSQIMRLCGGRNVFAELSNLAPRVSIEAVLEKNPQVIIASGMSQRRPEWLDKWKQWPQLQAVKNDYLFFIPPDIIQRHSLRILLGAQRLCEQLEKVRNE